MTPQERFKAEITRLLREHPMFPFFVVFGLDSLRHYLSSRTGPDLAVLFGGEFDPADIRAELDRIIHHLNTISGRRKNPFS